METRHARLLRRRCLIVERHPWETGGNQQQLQFVLQTAEQFFGPDNVDRNVRVRLWSPPDAAAPLIERDIVISARYANGTRRANGFPEIAAIPASFIFFQETADPDVYDCWWQEDKAVVAAKYHNWIQGRNSQHGRGRRSTIVDGPVPRVIRRIN